MPGCVSSLSGGVYAICLFNFQLYFRTAEVEFVSEECGDGRFQRFGAPVQIDVLLLGELDANATCDEYLRRYLSAVSWFVYVPMRLYLFPLNFGS